jgi:protein-tyrosine kinase
MADRSSRLDLIQRAAKRLKVDGEAVIAGLQPAFEQESELHTRPIASPAEPTISNPSQPYRTVQSAPDEAAKDIRLNFSELRRRGMITPDNLSSTISFEFRAIKRKLLAAARDANSNAITRNLTMITSALPGEGKTFTATNLALALAAERDLRVLLIDGDAIKPTVGDLFEHSSTLGFTDLLNGSCANTSDVMHRCTDIPNLSVIFAGKRDERAPELISSRRTSDLLAEISKRYDNRIVIFDTPPVLGSSEPANLAMYMHQIIVVVAAGAANRSQVQTALENISACPNVSIVFNKAPKWHKADSDTYYYYRSDGAPVVPRN